MLSTAVIPHVLQQPGLRYLTDTHCRRLLERYRVHGPLFYLLTVVVASQGWFTNPPQVTPHCVYISHIRSVPVPEIQSRLIEACIAGSRIMPRVAHYYFTLMMQRAVLRSFSLSVRSPLSHILKVQLPGYPTH